MENLDVKQIEETIHKYFKGFSEAEPALVSEAFHSETRLYSVEEGQLDKTEMKDWLLNLQKRKEGGEKREGTLEILLLDQTKEAAIVKVKITFKTMQFVDYLSLLKLGDAWKVVGKIYTVL